MRKAVTLGIFVVIFSMLAACGGNTKTPNLPDSQTKTQTAASTTENTTSVQTTRETSSQSSNSAVIAKSNNTVSSQDKEAVLKELDKELDELLSGINGMDDVQDSDVDLTQ